MISYEHQCIFVHIPKNGGSSIEDLIWPTEADRTEDNLWMGLVDLHHNKYQTGGLQHLLASQILQVVGAGSFQHFFKFTIVRNPWDKAVSQYVYMKRRPDLRRFLGMSRWTPFKRYLHLIQGKRHIQWEEQHRFIFDDNGVSLVDYIGRFEDFSQDVGNVLDELEKRGVWSGQQEIPHRNQSKRSHYRDYYDDESRELVRQIYAKDIDIFNYQF